ncbi:MAG: hypothetical protein SFV55_26790 [Haliscomenobacter sp.]|uniref:hypothetical protein n=1 Tax=Haliscomenobacter sp. TaxID=2717303 RepID=UPI0029B1DC62|nr:hypothetical protein [Haliscomenobacter sp.]MDX2072070.1 hypothetical protein [Haliscomenobacter sp.]
MRIIIIFFQLLTSLLLTAQNFQLSPQQFGAIPNDGKDDALALQQWIDAVVANKQTTGYLPEGIYDLLSGDRGLYFDGANANFVGDGPERSIIRAGINIEAVARINAGGQNISGIKFDANRKANHGLLMLKGAYGSFHRCAVSNALQDGILLPGAFTYTPNSQEWSARDLKGLPDKKVFNDPLLWEEMSVGGNGVFYCSQQKLVIGGPDHTVNVLGGQLEYSASTQTLIARGNATFQPTAPLPKARLDDLVRIPVLYSSLPLSSAITVPGKAFFTQNDHRIRISNPALYNLGIRSGDQITLTKNGIIKNFTIAKLIFEGTHCWVSLFNPTNEPTMDNADFTISTQQIFCITEIIDDKTVRVVALHTNNLIAKLPISIPPSDYVIMTGDGVREEPGLDNHINIWIGGVFRGNAGSGRSLRGTAGHNIIGGLTDYNGGYALSIGGIARNTVCHNTSVNKFYSESNQCGNILLGRCKAAFINSVHVGTLEAIEHFADGTFSTYVYSGSEINGSGVQLSKATNGVNFGNWNFNISNDEGVPLIDNRGGNKAPVMPIRGRTVEVGVPANGFIDLPLEVGFYNYWVAPEVLNQHKYIPNVTLVGTQAPVSMTGMFNETYGSTGPATSSIKFIARIRNTENYEVRVKAIPTLQFVIY